MSASQRRKFPGKHDPTFRPAPGNRSAGRLPTSNQTCSCLSVRLAVYCVNALTSLGMSAYINVPCTCCCMLITEPGLRQYSLRVPLIVGTFVCTHRIPNHIY